MSAAAMTAPPSIREAAHTCCRTGGGTFALLVVGCLALSACRSVRPSEFRIDQGLNRDQLPLTFQIDDQSLRLLPWSASFSAFPGSQDIGTFVDQLITSQGRLLVSTDEPRGTLRLGFEVRSHSANWFWIVPSMLTLGVLNILGFPAASQTCDVTVTLEVQDSTGAVLERYEGRGNTTEFSAAYWGYGPMGAVNASFDGPLSRASFAAAARDGLQQAVDSLRDDAPELRRVLRGLPTVSAQQVLQRQARLEDLLQENRRRLQALLDLQPGDSESSLLQAFSLTDSLEGKLGVLSAFKNPKRCRITVGLLPPPQSAASFHAASMQDAFDEGMQGDAHFDFPGLKVTGLDGRPVDAIEIATLTFDGAGALVACVLVPDASALVEQYSSLFGESIVVR